MNSWKTDTAVLLIFFVRDDTFRHVFESVRAARPRILLLWQDGPRENRPDDPVGIQACREIAESIDWDCEVHRMYHDKNMGCDPSTFYAMRWAFTIVDKCIILEDDQVPSASFYTYCVELLDKYKHDERISHINGHNYLGQSDCGADYLFAYSGTGAWASWRRVAETWEGDYAFLNDDIALDNVQTHYGKRSLPWIRTAQQRKQTGLEYWESIIGMGAAMQSRYAIIPRINLVKNIGVGSAGTHCSIDTYEALPKKLREFYEMAAMELSFPLKHPRYVIADARYIKKMEERSKNSFWSSISWRIEIMFNLLKLRKWKELASLITKKLK